MRDLSTRVDYKTVLSPEQFEIYSRLRDPRKILAEKDGLPVFAVFSNEQLATMVQNHAQTVADLQTLGKRSLHRCGS